MSTIAFIGLGNMGGPMAANLVKAGHKVVAFDLVEGLRRQAKSDGAAIAETAASAVKGADTVVTMLPAGKHVLSVWTDIVPSMTKGALIIDCSTIDVESAKQAHALAAKHGVGSVDAPVSGGTGGASRINVMVTRRLVAIEGSSGNSGWVSAFPTTLKMWALGTPSASIIRRTALARSADSSHGP